MTMAMVAFALSAAVGAAMGNTNLAAASRATSLLKASNGSFSAINLTVDTCNGVNGTITVTATGTTDDGSGLDTVWFTIQDDGIEKFRQSINIPVGSTVATVVSVSYPGQIGTSAPGIALVLGESDGSAELALNDNFFPTQVSGCSLNPAVAVPAQSPWSLAGISALLGMLGLGVLFARRRVR